LPAARSRAATTSEPADEHVDTVAAAAHVLAAAFERDQQPLDAGGPADRGNVEPEARQQRIVPAAAAQRHADLLDVASNRKPV